MNNIKVEITKSWRKSLSMRFDTQGVLQVKAPKFLLRPQIDEFISKNQSWIEKHHSKIQERNENKKYYLFGKEIELPLSCGHLPLRRRTKKASFEEGGGGTNVKSEGVIQEEFQKNIEKYYKSEAKKYIITRCNELAQKYGFTHAGIRITSATTRWGSCSSKKTLNFSYRLIMAPAESIDYVIIHELCHLRQMNHSHKFWSEVAAIMPSYKKYENHLKKEGWRYNI